MKILVSAYSCEPGRGSEPGVGWNMAKSIAKYHEVWVLTRPDEGADNIEAELQQNPDPNLHFIYFTLPIWSDGWKWGQGPIQLHYYLWQIQAYFVARRLHQEIGFDVAQHITFVKYSIPSFLSLLPIPFVWGPVGGGESTPKPFLKTFSRRGKLYETLRTWARWVGELDPFVRLTASRSVIALATTHDTEIRLKALKTPNVEVFSQCGLSPTEIADLSRLNPPPDRPIRFVSIGRLLHWKGFYLGLEAFAKANLKDAEYWIIGDGPERQRWETLAENLGIASQVKFYGDQSRENTLNLLGMCHALVHPSLHDSGGLVCLEAMAAGRPVICLDLGGPATQVTVETGFKITAQTPEQAIQDLAEAMTCLATNSNLRIEQGNAAQQRVKSVYDWTVKGKFLAEIYEKVVGKP